LPVMNPDLGFFWRVVPKDPNYSYSVWRFVSSGSGGIVDLIFYPSEGKVRVKTTPDDLGRGRWYGMFRSGGVYSYRITDDRLYFLFNSCTGEVGSDIVWDISFPTENEMSLRYARTTWTDWAMGFRFVSQTDFKYPMEAEGFCSYFNMENIYKTIPIVNEFLAELPNGTSREQTFELLVEWFNSFSCDIDARILWGVDIIWGQERMRGVGIPIKDGERIRMLEVDFAIINNALTHTQIAGYSYHKQDAIHVQTTLTRINEVFAFINSRGFDVKRIEHGCYISSMPANQTNLEYIRSNLLTRPYVDSGWGVAAHLNWYTPGITFFVQLTNMHNKDYQEDWIKTMSEYRLVEWNHAMAVIFYIPEDTGEQWKEKFEQYDFVRWAERTFTRYTIR